MGSATAILAGILPLRTLRAVRKNEGIENVLNHLLKRIELEFFYFIIFHFRLYVVFNKRI